MSKTFHHDRDRIRSVKRTMKKEFPRLPSMGDSWEEYAETVREQEDAQDGSNESQDNRRRSLRF